MGLKVSSSWHYPMIALILVLLLSLSALFCQSNAELRKMHGEAVLAGCEQTILLNLRKNFNYAAVLRTVMLSGGAEYFETASQELMQWPACVYTERLEGKTLAQVYPRVYEQSLGIGSDITALDYAHTLARLKQDLVVEGPTMQGGREVFLSIEPIFEDGRFAGEVVAALDSAVVLAALDLENLTRRGYEYELWRVHPRDGRKQQIALSSGDVDFSKAIETKFKLPSTWTLSIIPFDGWYNRDLVAVLIGGSFAITLLLALMMRFYGKNQQLQQTMRLEHSFDAETGLRSRASFLTELALWTVKPAESFSLLYVMIDNYNDFTQRGALEEKRELLDHITSCFHMYVKSEHLAARIGEGNFVLAIREHMSQEELANLQKGLTIELLWKFIRDGEKLFLTAQCSGCQFPQDAEDAESLLRLAVQRCYTQIAGQNPAQDLAARVERILSGEDHVLFGEYRDADMNRLTRVLTRYRKKVSSDLAAATQNVPEDTKK